jgi:hypothetical protein
MDLAVREQIPRVFSPIGGGGSRPRSCPLPRGMQEDQRRNNLTKLLSIVVDNIQEDEEQMLGKAELSA